jgi:anaerobic ribonucleoside-triphosphate reductase activating protein
MQLRIAGTVEDSIVDGEGIRYTIFVQGCPHHCPGCHNPQTHDMQGGEWADTDTLLEQIASDPLLDGVTFSGGEPFCQAAVLAELGKAIHAKGLNLVTYTGYTFETLLQSNRPDWMALLAETDILIDGRFEQDKKSYECRFRGSTNQRYLDAKASLAAGVAVEATMEA